MALYMPAIEALPIAMLACARIGAVHSVVFGGFSADSLASRIVDCKYASSPLPQTPHHPHPHPLPLAHTHWPYCHPKEVLLAFPDKCLWSLLQACFFYKSDWGPALFHRKKPCVDVNVAIFVFDCRAKVLLTSTGSMRGKKPILLKQIADDGIDIAAKQGFNVSSLTNSMTIWP